MKRFAFWLAGAAAAVGLALTGAGYASAAVNPADRLVSNGTAGYYALSDGANSIGYTVESTSAALNIGGVGTGGIGSEMCDPNNAYALQQGETTNGSTVTIEYDAGILNNHKCVGGGVLTSPAPRVLNASLTGLNVTDIIQGYTHYKTLRVNNVWCSTNPANPCRRHKIYKGFAQFAAFDATIGFDVFNVNVWVPPFLTFTENGVGVQQDTTGMSACTPTATNGNPITPPTGYTGVTPTGYSPTPDGVTGSGACNLIASFSGVSLDGAGIFSPSFIGLAATGHFGLGPAVQVVTTGGALHGNAAIVAPNNTLAPTAGFGSSSLGVFGGQVLG